MIVLKDFLDMMPLSQVVRVCDLHRSSIPTPYFDTYDVLTVIKGKAKHLLKNHKIYHIPISTFEIIREPTERHPIIVAWVDAYAPEVMRHE